MRKSSPIKNCQYLRDTGLLRGMHTAVTSARKGLENNFFKEGRLALKGKDEE